MFPESSGILRHPCPPETGRDSYHPNSMIRRRWVTESSSSATQTSPDHLHRRLSNTRKASAAKRLSSSRFWDVLEELRRRNYAESTINTYHPHGRTFQLVLPSFARSAWPRAHSSVSGCAIHSVEAGPEHRNPALGSLTLLLCSGVEARLRHRIQRRFCICRRC